MHFTANTLFTDYSRGDVFSTASQNDPNPLTGSFFLLEKAEKDEPAPKYDYDESGVVLKGLSKRPIARGFCGPPRQSANAGFCMVGELHIADEKGNGAKLSPGDTFFIHRGSTITFSTPRYAVAYKVAARRKN